MDLNMANKNPFINAKGTTCKSFKIGKKNVSFASNSIDMTKIIDAEKFNNHYLKYKNMVVEEDDSGNYIVYDYSIPSNAVRMVLKDDNNGKPKYRIVLYSGEEIPLNGSSSATEIDWDEQQDEQTGQEKRVLVYDTTDGKFQKSIYSIMMSGDLPKYDENKTGLDRLQAIADAYNKDSRDFDKQIPTMKSVMNYVGNISDILAARLGGDLPGDAKTH